MAEGNCQIQLFSLSLSLALLHCFKVGFVGIYAVDENCQNVKHFHILTQFGFYEIDFFLDDLYTCAVVLSVLLM